jgi:hypothetical protein
LSVKDIAAVAAKTGGAHHGTGRKLIISLARLRQMVVSHTRHCKSYPIWYAVSFTRQLRAVHAPNGSYFEKVNKTDELDVGGDRVARARDANLTIL